MNSLEWGWFIGLIGVSLVFCVISWWLFQRRDIRITGERSWLSFMNFRRGKSEQVMHSTT
jgi:hypothetical protein